MPVFLPGESHDSQRSQAGYSPWGCKELDTTKQLNTHTHTGGLDKRTESLGSCLPENKAPEASRPLPPCPREGIGLAEKLIWVF